MIILEPLSFETLAPGLTHERSADGRLVIFTLADYELSTIEAWLTAITTSIKEWPEDQPYLVLYQFARIRKPGDALLLFSRLDDMQALAVKNRTLYIAVVFADVWAASVGRVLVAARVLAASKRFIITAEAFSDRAEGLAWLISIVPWRDVAHG